MNAPSMKTIFGKRFRQVRDARKLSRAALAMRLGISPKTIQSWEMGRTFIEKLSLVPAIEKELNVPFGYIIGALNSPDALSEMAAESPVAYGGGGAKAKAVVPADRAAAGPLAPQLVIEGADKEIMRQIDGQFLAAPVIKPKSAGKEIAELQRRDILQYTLFPAEWCTRGRVLVAYRMADSSLAPAVPQDSIVIVDRRVSDPGRLEGRFAALWLADRGLRIREIRNIEDKVYGSPFGARTRGEVTLRFDKGDRILGPVLGYYASFR